MLMAKDLAKEYPSELKELGLTLDKEDDNTVCAVPNTPVNTKLIEICCQLQRRLNKLDEQID